VCCYASDGSVVRCAFEIKMICECGHQQKHHCGFYYGAHCMATVPACGCKEFTLKNPRVLCKCNHTESEHLDGVCQISFSCKPANFGSLRVYYCPCVKFEGVE